MIAIYKTMLKSTGRVVYVGQTTHPENVGTKYFGTTIHKSFNNMSYIREHFVSEIITITEDQQKANDLEIYYIDYYCTLEENGGFNVSLGGLGTSLPGEKHPMYGRTGEKHPLYGKALSEEHKQKLSEAHKGKILTEEAKRKLSDANTGKTLSEETKRKMSENHVDFSGENNPCYGKKLMNDGITQKYIPKDEVEMYLEQGWKLGKLHK